MQPNTRDWLIYRERNRAEYRAYLLLLECLYNNMDTLRKLFEALDRRGLNISFI